MAKIHANGNLPITPQYYYELMRVRAASGAGES
jgi:hypothetical protein